MCLRDFFVIVYLYEKEIQMHSNKTSHSKEKSGTTMRKKSVIQNLIGILFVLLAAACRNGLQKGNRSSDISETLVDSGSWYSREKWPHDGKPYESLNFIIYSDAASQESREELAGIAEELLAELIIAFGIDTEEMLRYPPGQKKIHIYSYKEYYPKQWGMRAYHGGIIAWSLDHEHRNTNLGNYKPVLKHELVHVIESLLKGRDVANMAPDVRTQAWFSEGLAEAVAGGTSASPVRGQERFVNITAQYGTRNPIAYKTDGVLIKALNTDPMIGFDYYYPMSQLAVEYLLDVDGLGKSLFNVRDIFLDMAEGVDFSTAFEKHMGISIQAYEADFFDLMDSYLARGMISILLRTFDLWVILSLASVIIIVWTVFRGNKKVLEIVWIWFVLVMFFGPLGLIVYRISGRYQELRTSRWWRGLLGAMVSVSGKGVGLLIMICFYQYIAPDADAGPMIILVPFLVGWMIFRAPLDRSIVGISYWRALYRSSLIELGSTVLVLVGMLPILIILPDEFWFFSRDPVHPLFWGLVSLSSITGTVTVYLYSVWLEHRRSAQDKQPEMVAV